MAQFNSGEASRRFSKVEQEMGDFLKTAYEHKQNGNTEQAIESFQKAITTYNDVMMHINQVYQAGNSTSLDARKTKLRTQYDDAKNEWQDLKFEQYQTLKAAEVAEKSDAIKEIVRNNLAAFRKDCNYLRLHTSKGTTNYLSLNSMKNQAEKITDQFLNNSENHLKDYPEFVNQMSKMMNDHCPKFSPSFMEKIADIIPAFLNSLYSVINYVAKSCGAKNNLINPHTLISDYYADKNRFLSNSIQQFKDDSEVASEDLEIKTTYQV